MITNPGGSGEEALAALVHHLLNPDAAGARMKERSAELVAALKEFKVTKAQADDLSRRVAEVTARENAITEREAALATITKGHEETAASLSKREADIAGRVGDVAKREAAQGPREKAVTAAEAELEKKMKAHAAVVASVASREKTVGEKETAIAARERAVAEQESQLAPLRELAKKLA